MKQLVLILTLIISSQVFSQNFVMTWSKCYGGSVDDQVDCIISYKKGYLFFGSTKSSDGDISYNPYSVAAWLVNINDQGDILFDTCYNGFDWAWGRNIFEIENGGYYFVGSSGKNDGSKDGYWLAMVDSSFNIIWQDVLGGSYADDPRGGCIAQDGGVIETGITGSPDGDVEEYYGSFDNWLVKKNSDGSTGWVKTYGNIGAEEGGNITPTNDGGYIYACAGENFLPGNTYCEGHSGRGPEAWIIKLNAAGEKEWHRCYGGSHIEILRESIELNDGYIFLGFTESNDGDINNFHGVAGEAYDVWVLRTNFDGEIIWSNCYGGSKREHGKKIFKNSDNTFTIIATTHSNDGDIQNINNPNNKSVLWLFKINMDGELIYQKAFDEFNNITVRDIYKASEYKYIVPFYKDYGCNFMPNNHNDDIYVVEIQDMDEFIPNQPVGADEVCVENNAESIYTTNLVVDTMATQWLLIPEEAGTLTPMHDSVLIHWNQNFADTALLQVRAINEYGESSYSESKEIIVYPPLVLSNIAGPDSVCTANNQQSVFTTQIGDEVDINWYLEPETAGNINNQQDTAVINWNPAYEGMVSLKTAAFNPCNEEEYSPLKEVMVKTCTGIGEIQAKQLKVYPNPASNQITFKLPQISKESFLCIKDVFGKTVKEVSLLREQTLFVWDCSQMTGGVYFYQTQINGEIYRGKIIVN